VKKTIKKATKKPAKKPTVKAVKTAVKAKTAKKATTFGALRTTLEQALGVAAPPVHVHVPPPAPAPLPPVPTATSQAWRANVDWVAAGKKAHESRLRNAALRAAAGATPVPKPTYVTSPVSVGWTRPQVQPAPVAPKEEHTSTSTRSHRKTASRTTSAPRRSTTSRSSSSTRR